MALQLGRAAAFALALLSSAVCFGPASAADCGGQCSQPLFQNYYVGPGRNGTVGAQLYLSPRPVPPLVGHTYITYQPLMPHEYLYHHHTVYHTNHGGGSNTRTSVRYQSFRVPMIASGAWNVLPILPH